MPTEIKAQNTTTLASVKAIYDAADQANTLLDGMQAAATAAGTTLDGIYQDAADAQTAADDAQASADNASEYAARALGNLSTVQNITETLNWITAHGTMTLTSDVALDPTHVYFVVDQAGDYVVGGTHYSVVTEPDVDDISTYYELSINESLNNYVATHLAVDSEGLWIIPDAGGNKVLIATGSGSTYTTAGTYIVGKVNNVDTVLASFTASGAQIGQSGQSNLQIDNHSMRLLDYNNNEFFHVSDLRTWQNVGGQTVLLADITESFTHDKNTSPSVIYVSFSPYSVGTTTVTVNGSNVPVTSVGPTPDGRYQIQLQSAYSYGDYVVVNYKTLSDLTKAYTVGSRLSGSNIGAYSYAEGYDTTASGHYSHAEGLNTTASGQVSHAENSATASGIGSHAENYATASGQDSHAEGELSVASGICSHAEGCETTASGTYSHTQNYGTKASSAWQTALGRFNVEDNADTYAVIVGNGGNNNSRSNALTVDWSGNVEAAGGMNIGSGHHYQINGTNLSASDVSAVPSVVANTYGTLYAISSNLSLSTSGKKVPLTTFSGDGCQLSSNGIKVATAGKYRVEGAAYFSTGFTANDIVHLALYKNSSSQIESVKRLSTTNPYEIVFTGSCIMELSANDVVYLYAYNQTGARGVVGNHNNTRLTINRIA